MGIDLKKIEREYAKGMLDKYNKQMERFKDVFENPNMDRGGMNITLTNEGDVVLRAGFGANNTYNISNNDARNILNIIRISIQDRIDKFTEDEK